MLFQYYLASLALVSLSCISSVWFRGTAHLYIKMFSPSQHCLSIELEMFLKHCAVQDKRLCYSVPSVFTVEVSLALVLTLGVLCFSSLAAFQFYAKTRGLNHSHAPHPPLSTLTFTTRQLPIRPRIKYGGHSNKITLMTCWRHYLFTSCYFCILCQLAFSFCISPGSVLVNKRCLAAAGACTKLP